MHPVKDIRVWPWWVELGADVMPTGSRRASNNYITRCHRQVQSWSQDAVVRTSTQQRAMGPQDPRLSSSAEQEKDAGQNKKETEELGLNMLQPSRTRKRCWAEQERDRGTGAQYVAVCSVSNSPLTHNPFTTISKKVWEVYFSKEQCLFIIIVLTMFPHVYVYSCIYIMAIQHPYKALLKLKKEIISFQEVGS